MKVIMTGGGTGGHIYPAIAIADKIKERHPEADILFVGTEKGLEKTIVPKNGYPIKFITVSGLSRKNPIKAVKTLADFMKGSRQAREILNSFKPDAVIGTGGYVCGPMVRAAKQWGAATFIHEQNALPGVTNKLLEKHADKVFISFDAAEKHFKNKKKLVMSGNPVRDSFYKADREEARKALGIRENDFVILSFGGSRGAGKINEMMFPVLKQLNGRANVLVLFVTGSLYYDAMKKRAEEEIPTLQDNIKLLEYIDRMDKYLPAADLIISRSGALTVSEITVCGKPAILIPSPNVTGNHQYFNAKAVADKGGAVIIEEKDINPELLLEKIEGLMREKQTLEEMGQFSKAAAPPRATEIICSCIEEALR